MHLKTKNGSAYIHNYNHIDDGKENVLFIPGAGMDHRVADLINLDKKIFNEVISIDLPGHGGSTPTNAKTIEDYSEFISNCLSEIKELPIL